MTNSIGYCCIPTAQDAGGQYTRTATIWDRGVETLLTVRKIVNVKFPTTKAYTPGVFQYDEQITLPYTAINYYEAQPGKYLGKFGGQSNAASKHAVYLGSKPAVHTATISRSDPFWAATDITLTQGKAQYQTIIPSETLINLAPTLVTQAHPIRPTELYAGGGKQYLSGKFLPLSNAWQFYYEVWYIFDANRVPDVRRRSIYMGHARFGIHKYTAESLIQITTKYPIFLSNTSYYMYGFFHKRDDRPINKVRRAVTASMALRDTVLIDTNVHRKLQLRDIISPDGTHFVGELVEN